MADTGGNGDAGDNATIRTLLIANRGEIACRIARTCARLGIRTVAVHSTADAAAMHVRCCDSAVHLPGDAPGDTYLRIDLLVQAAQRSGADAVHPGYGFLAENAEFAQAVIDAGLIWVGPPPAAIAAMGSKVGAKAMMRSAGVPVLPDSTVEGVEAIGVPMLIKASAGGGGRGMRIVRRLEDLESSLGAAEREAISAFGDGTVFCERYVERGRHIEVQVFADAHGTTTSLFERECSIQRRHQKVVEESPSPAVGPELRERLCSAAVTAAREVRYRGAGTVEFLLDTDGRFYFLEMNTRLQVEHPVTEMVTGLDLVELQLLVAEGHALPPEAVAATLRGHAIEVRLTAEDPAAGYLPVTGTFHRFQIPGADHRGLRVDTGIESGSVVSPHYDSMVAKIIAHGTNRAAAIRLLADGLRTAKIHGPVTNLDQLRNICDHPDFIAGRLSTAFLEDFPCTEPRETGPLPVLAASLAVQARNRAASRVQSQIPSGWRNNPAVDQSVQFEPTLGTPDGPQAGPITVRYRLGRSPAFFVDIGDGEARIAVELIEASSSRVVFELDGMRSEYSIHVIADPADQEDGNQDAGYQGAGYQEAGHRDAGRPAHLDLSATILIYVDGPDGTTTLRMLPRFPLTDAAGSAGSLTAPMPGAIRRIHVSLHEVVVAGQALVALEAMKMEHQVTAPADGIVVEILVTEGDQVDTGQTLLVMEDCAPVEDAAVEDAAVEDAAVEDAEPVSPGGSTGAP
jgi:propionyl-CoA carboxylase alpha chain